MAPGVPTWPGEEGGVCEDRLRAALCAKCCLIKESSELQSRSDEKRGLQGQKRKVPVVSQMSLGKLALSSDHLQVAPAPRTVSSRLV